MSTRIYDGRQVREIELLNVFPPAEGEITQYYGRIGQGKTYNATADILDLLRRGYVVYCNWRINWDGFDQRRSFLHVFVSIILPWRKRFYTFKKDNLKYLPVDEHFHDTFEKLTDCYVFLDEGHVVFDSYEMAKLSLAKRASILHTRHFNRSICIISQRPTAIHVAMRANVNRFYKCEKRWQWGPLIRFRRTEFQDMLNETVDDDEEKAISIKQYWGKASVFNAYPSKYLRGDTPDSQKIEFEAHDFGYVARFALLFRAIFGRKNVPVVKGKLVEKIPLPVIGPVVELKNEQKPADASRLPVPVFGQEPEKETAGASKTPRKVGKKKQDAVLTNVEKADTVKVHRVTVQALVILSALFFPCIYANAASIYNAPYGFAWASTTSGTYTTSAEFTIGAWLKTPAGVWTDTSFRSAVVSFSDGAIFYSSQAGSEYFGLQYRVVGSTRGLYISGWNAEAYMSDNNWHFISMTARQVGADVRVELWVDGVFRSSRHDAGQTLSAPTDSAVMIGRRYNGNVANNWNNVYYNYGGAIAGLRYYTSAVSSSTQEQMDNCMLTEASSTVAVAYRLDGDFVGFGNGVATINNFGLTSTTTGPSIYGCPVPAAPATPSTTTASTTGPNLQEWLFVACSFLFFVSLGAWGRIYQKL